MKTGHKEGVTSYTFKCPPALWGAFKKLAADHGIFVADMVTRTIEQAVKNEAGCGGKRPGCMFVGLRRKGTIALAEAKRAASVVRPRVKAVRP